MIPPVPSLLGLVELADCGGEQAAENALDRLIAYRVWNLFVLTRNGQSTGLMWGRNKMDAMMRGLPSMMQNEYIYGQDNTPNSGWAQGDVAALEVVESVGEAVAGLGEVYKRSFVRSAWRELQRERGVQVTVFGLTPSPTLAQ